MKRLRPVLLFVILGGIIAVAVINVAVIAVFSRAIETGPGAVAAADAVLIPGAAVWRGGTLSFVLRDRVDAALDVYRAGKAPRILVSGDHGTRYYDEVNAVRTYLIQRGVPPRDIFMDHAGFSTYDSLYRARTIFQVRSVIIVTQRFHLSRALFIARALGLDAAGIAADRRVYENGRYYWFREILARCKALFDVVRHARPRLLGPPIPITGDGRSTGD